MTTLHPLVERLGRRITSLPLWGPPRPHAPGAIEIKEVRDVAYREGASADPIRHRLDLFIPQRRKGYPVVVLVHGGHWTIGDNRSFGLYSSVGSFLASQGIGAVVPNYRLSPLVVHPEHAKDIARAVRWTHDHIAEYGGSPNQIFLMGHSAGGHLVSLLATDPSYLNAEGLSLRDVKGVISVSGIYHIPPGPIEVFLGGRGSRAFRLDEFFPFRGETTRFSILPSVGVPIKVEVYGLVFGNEPKGRTEASPISHAHRGLPPFLILVGEKDLPTLADMAEEFHETLLREGCANRLLQVKNRNHNSLMFSMISPDDPAARAVLEFLGSKGN
jgi:acetyl esterase/lipase